MLPIWWSRWTAELKLASACDSRGQNRLTHRGAWCMLFGLLQTGCRKPIRAASCAHTRSAGSPQEERPWVLPPESHKPLQ
jgi:hypothetical protein